MPNKTRSLRLEERELVKNRINEFLDQSFQKENKQSYPEWQIVMILLEVMANEDYYGELAFNLKNGYCFGVEGMNKMNPGFTPGPTKDLIDEVYSKDF